MDADIVLVFSKHFPHVHFFGLTINPRDGGYDYLGFTDEKS